MSDDYSGRQSALTSVSQKGDAVTEEPFVLDRVENPHPRMLAGALKARGASGDSAEARAYWDGYMAAMADATGEPVADLEAWMDRNA